MFEIGDGVGEGKSDVNPIILEGEQKGIFDLFLTHIHGQ